MALRLVSVRHMSSPFRLTQDTAFPARGPLSSRAVEDSEPVEPKLSPWREARSRLLTVRQAPHEGVPLSNATAAAFAAVMFAALYAGHHVGDHVVQSSAVAAAKSVPHPDALAAGVPPWTGWGACLRHVAGYAATQAAALALVCVVVPLEIVGMATALVVSASTHAVIDRRWIVHRLIELKRCHDWAEAPYVLDQSLHMGAMLVAAVLSVAVSDVAGLVMVLAGAGAVVGAALTMERRFASAHTRSMDSLSR